nr:recombination protein O N-terminal domain-containing protein [Allomuricauda sp.]
MQVSTKAIVLSSLKYGDTSLIVKMFTQSDGLKSYLLKGVLSAKRGKLKPAYFLPLMQLEIVASHKNKGTLERILETKVLAPYKSLHTDIVKNSVVLFFGRNVGKQYPRTRKRCCTFQLFGIQLSLVGRT